MHYVELFFSNLFAWVIVIFAVVFVVYALAEIGDKIHKMTTPKSNADARTPSVQETLSALEYAGTRNAKQRRK